jgi:hypothetical protein
MANLALKIHGTTRVLTLYYKKTTPHDDSCICIVERSGPLVQADLISAQVSSFAILENAIKVNNEDAESSSIERSPTASLSSRLPSSMVKSDFAEEPDMVKEKKPKIKRQCFEDRLKMALERAGSTSDCTGSSHEQQRPVKPPSMGYGMIRTMQYLSDDAKIDDSENYG